MSELVAEPTPTPTGPTLTGVEVTERGLRREHLTDLAAIVGVVFVLIAIVRTTVRLTHVLGLVTFAVVLSYLTMPLRRLLIRRVGHGVAAVLVPLTTFVVIVGIGIAVSGDITTQAARLANVLNRAVAGLQPGSLPARIADSVKAEQAISDALARTGTTVVAGQGSAGGLSSSIGDLVVVIILGAFLQGTGTTVVDRTIAFWPRPRRKAIRERWNAVDAKAGATFRGAVLLALAVGSVVSSACAALGIPGALILGAWAGLWASVPTIGTTIGFAPVLGVAILQTSVATPIALLISLCVAASATVGRRRLRERAQTQPGPATWVLSFAGGYAVAGTAGLVIAFGAVAYISAFLATPPGGDPTPVVIDRSPLFGVDGTEEWWRSVLTRRGIAVMVCTCVAATLTWTLLGSLGVFSAWLFVGVLLGVGFDRPVAMILRHTSRVPRAAAAAFVMTVFLALVAGIVMLAAQGGARNNVSLNDQLPVAVTRFERAPLIGPVLRDHQAAAWVKDELQKLPKLLSTKGGYETLLPSIGARFGDVFWTLTLTLALLIDGPRLVAESRKLLPVRLRRQFGTFVSISHEAVGGYLAGSAVIAGLDAIVVLITALVLRVPLAPALAGWALLTNFLPQIGGLLGGTPLVVLAFTVGPTQAGIALVVFVLYQFLENHVIGPNIISRAVDIPPVASLLAALVGAAAAGMLGALLLTPLVGVYKVIREIARRGEIPGQQVLLEGA